MSKEALKRAYYAGWSDSQLSSDSRAYPQSFERWYQREIAATIPPYHPAGKPSNHVLTYSEPPIGERMEPRLTRQRNADDMGMPGDTIDADIKRQIKPL